MSLAITRTRVNIGIHAKAIVVETDISNGYPSFNIVGLPETGIKESKHRIRSALVNSAFTFPAKRITVNLAPADIPKEGCHFDLPIALGILAASAQIDLIDEHAEFAGELALTGDLRRISGILPMALACKKAGRILFIPNDNAYEASLVHELRTYAPSGLLPLIDHLQKNALLNVLEHTPLVPLHETEYDVAEVKGQVHAKQALSIAAAGGHSLLMCGPPGAGKTMLARCLPSLLPPLTEQEALEAQAIRSVAGIAFTTSQFHRRMLRSPHHTASSVALVGGGSPPRPGEISLAHHGVLFLDELPEFGRTVLETLRQPLESGVIEISRAARQATFPANFQLIAAMNPCPCGYYGDPNNTCQCSNASIERYQKKLSGPLLDRIDCHIWIQALKLSELQALPCATQTSNEVQQTVIKAREQQITRQGRANHLLTGRALKQHCTTDAATLTWFTHAAEQLSLSARAYNRVMRVARTIADLEESSTLSQHHFANALSYRGIGSCN